MSGEDNFVFYLKKYKNIYLSREAEELLFIVELLLVLINCIGIALIDAAALLFSLCCSRSLKRFCKAINEESC